MKYFCILLLFHEGLKLVDHNSALAEGDQVSRVSASPAVPAGEVLQAVVPTDVLPYERAWDKKLLSTTSKNLLSIGDSAAVPARPATDELQTAAVTEARSSASAGEILPLFNSTEILPPLAATQVDMLPPRLETDVQAPTTPNDSIAFESASKTAKKTKVNGKLDAAAEHAAATAVQDEEFTENLPTCDDATQGLGLIMYKPGQLVKFQCAAAYRLMDPDADDLVYEYDEGVCKGPLEISKLVKGATLRKNAEGTTSIVNARQHAEAQSLIPGESVHVLTISHLPTTAKTLCLQCLPVLEHHQHLKSKTLTTKDDSIEAFPGQACLILIDVNANGATSTKISNHDSESTAVDLPADSAGTVNKVQTSAPEGSTTLSLQQQLAGQEEKYLEGQQIHKCSHVNRQENADEDVAVGELSLMLLPGSPIRFYCDEADISALHPLPPMLVYDNSEDGCSVVASEATNPQRQKQMYEHLQGATTYAPVEILGKFVPSAKMEVAFLGLASDEADSGKNSDTAHDSIEGEKKTAIYTLSVNEPPHERKHLCYICKKRQSPSEQKSATSNEDVTNEVRTEGEFLNDSERLSGGISTKPDHGVCVVRITVPSSEDIASMQEDKEADWSVVVEKPRRKFVLPF